MTPHDGPQGKLSGLNSDKQERLLHTIECLLGITALQVNDALSQASDLIAEALGAAKVDVFLYEPTTASLVAYGTSDTPMGRLQHAIGMNRLPIANRGRTVDVFESGESFRTGRSDTDPEELVGIKEGLGVRSSLLAPLEINGERRGVLSATSDEPERYTEDDLRFLEAAANWIAIVLQRAELVEQIARDAAAQARRATADELIAMLAHDLRSPLTPLFGWAHMLRGRAAQDDRQQDVRHADMILRGLVRLQRLVDDLLDTARLDEGIFALAPEPVNLAEVTREVVNTIATSTSHIEVRGPDEVSVYADSARVRQVLENLIGNAHRHAGEDMPIMVELATETRGDGEWAMVSVRDQGPGVPADLLPQLFTRFRRGTGSRGLGLGLYLARGIAEAHGGTLSVDSPPGQGATFTLAIPVATNDD